MKVSQLNMRNGSHLRHPNLTLIKPPSFYKAKRKKYCLNILTACQLSLILSYLKLNQIMCLYISVKGSRLYKQIEKTIIRYLIQSNITFTKQQQKDFMEVVIGRSNKTKNVYKSNKSWSWYRQIINQDVQRTYSSNFSNQEQTQKMKHYLNNILCSLSNVFFKVGYIQGINYVIRNMYENNYSQIDGFNYACYLFSQMQMQLLFTSQLSKVQQLCYVFQVYMFNYLPQIYHYLKKMSVPTQIFAPSWFITLYSQHLPTKTVNKIWNLFFIKGWKIIIKFGLEVLCSFQTQILSHSSDFIFKFMRDILLYVDQKRQPMIWKIMTSLKVTNHMVTKLSKEMSQVHKDTEIQLWRLQNTNKNKNNRSLNDSFNQQYEISSPIFTSRLCCNKFSQDSSSLFQICKNAELN